MRTLTICALAGSIAGVVLLGGCSGAGLTAFDAAGGSLRTLAADHLAALVLVRSWLVALHSEPESGSIADFTREELPDGSTRYVGTNSDGSSFDYILRPDGSGEGTWWLATGNSFSTTWTPTDAAGAVSAFHVTKTFDDGTALVYDYVVDFSNPAVQTGYDGDATLPDGRTMEFAIRRTAGDREIVALDLPDGAHCEYEVPLRTVGLDAFAPDYAGTPRGRYINPSGARLDFTLAGRGSRWVRWRLTAADGTSGEFTLAPDYSGDGTLTEGGSVIGALHWSADAMGVLDLLTAESAEVGPTGAALDFAIDRWIENAALLGPAPMY